MNESVGNLEVFITKGASPYCANNVKIKLTVLSRPIRSYEMESVDSINPQHRVKFENIPLGHYEIEAACKGYINKKDFLHVKFPGADTHWKGHFRKSRNSKKLNIEKKSSEALSAKGIDLLKSIEELSTKPYDDQTGKAITNWVKGATIGYGHLIAKAEWETYKNGITESQALMLFKSDLAPYEKTVKTLVNLPLLQNQFDALVILAYNIGHSAFATSSVLKLVNDSAAATPYPSLEEAWLAWNTSQGKTMKGLTNRRR
ncbi:MAG: lysozyme, partial [Desulfatitalea sp.]